jgi:hypothetical protein
MSSNKIHNGIKNRKTTNDVIHTPPSVALQMIEMCELKEGEKVLDPSAGDNKVFYNNFPDFVNKDYCEITEGKDFFEYNKKVDCVIGNPPYSMWDKWLQHTMEITDKFCYIFNNFNFTPSRLTKIMNNGYGITKLHLVTINWWFGPSVIAVFEKNKKSLLTTSSIVNCEFCGKSCNRGRRGNSMNECIPKVSKNKK